MSIAQFALKPSILKKLDEDVLIIETNQHVVGILQILLKHEHFSSAVLGDGLAAMEIIDNYQPPKLLIMDTNLPFADGYTILKHIRANAYWKNLPVILVSKNSKEKDIVKGFKLGANDYVVKPFIPAELMLRLKRLLNVAA